MRMYFQPEDADAFEAAKAPLIRRCAAGAGNEDVDPLILESALNFRHHSIDGRLGYWTAGLVWEFLISYLPRTLSVAPEEAGHGPEDLRLFLRYLAANGLADPGGDPLANLEAAITQAGAGFVAAMADEQNFGVGKFWVMNAFRHGVDPTDNAAMDRFLDEVRAGEVDYDEKVLEEIASRHLADGGTWPERAVPQLPVSLPPDAELTAAAERTQVVARLRTLAEWVGDGRTLTSTGLLKLADARDLVPLLDTGDEIDRAIGDRVYRTQSSGELPELTGMVELAKKTRIVRTVKGKLVRVAKNARLLRDSLGLWTAAFDGLPSPELVLRGRTWAPEYSVLFSDLVEEVLPDVLNSLYSFPEPMPVVRLEESVWLSFAEAIWLEELDEKTETEWRRGIGEELRQVFAALADFGAVTLTTGAPDPVFGFDLGPDGPGVFPPDADARLRSALSAETTELVALTPLAVRAIRARMVAAGRHAPLIGELADAEPAGLLGTVAEHYTSEATEAELTGWLAAHGGRERALPLLLDAVRGCPFRTRASAMLHVLAQGLPDGSAVLQALRDDWQLGPIAVQLLIGEGELSMAELGDEEALRGMAEQFIQLLETGGPDAIADTLATMPPDEARGLTANVLNCGHPDAAGLAELRELFARRRPRHATVHPLGGISRSPKKSGKKRRR